MKNALETLRNWRCAAREYRQKFARFFQTQQDLNALLTDAALANDLSAAETAIGVGSRCDDYCPAEKNPALLAIKNKNDALLQLLLDKNVLKDGANTCPNYYDGPLIAHAIREGNKQAFATLVAAGANLNPELQGDGCLITIALRYKRYEMAQYMIDKGVPTDKKDNRGWTPLFWAAHLGLADFTRTFLEKNARTYLHDNNGNSVLDVAYQAEKFAVYNIIQKHIDDAVPRWRKTGDDTVAHTDIVRGGGYKLTQVFNFRTSQHTHITHNFATGVEVPVTKSFDALAQPELIAEAKKQLETLKV